MTSVEDILALTRQALDDFETVPLAASLRRAERIARLRGDTHYTLRFQLDLRPNGGSTAWSRTEAYDLFMGESFTDGDIDAWRSQIFEEWIKERTPSKLYGAMKEAFGDGQLIGGSIESVIRHSVLMERNASLALAPEAKLQTEIRREYDLEVIERATHRAFTYLCTVERDLSYIGVNADIFERHRRRVESFLSQISPKVLDQFTAAYRRAREDDPESKTHALTTCRRILESVADVVYPPRAEPVTDSGGRTRNVGQENYINRLWMFVADAMAGSTQSKLLLATLTDFGDRIDKVYSLTNKGVHDDVAQAEVDTCVMQTYLLAGEILRIFEDSPKGAPAESSPAGGETTGS